MENLSRELIKSGFKFPADVKVNEYRELPEKVLQFGEGNFLRGFVDWMFNRMNQQDLFNGRVVVVQPIANGMADMLNKQDNVYTLLLRGIQNGAVAEEKEVITSISRSINPYSDFQKYMKCAENPELRVIVSNTTEAGISYSPDDKFEDAPPASYPGKLTVFLHKRYKFFNGDMSKGFIIIPCELIDRNGDVLKKVVLQLADEWDLGSEFINWIEKANFFFNTLVDRIVTGFPKDDFDKLTRELGYRDNGLDTAEIYHFWAIEGDTRFAEEIPFTKAGLDVVWTEDMTPYRSRKVRILNGAHTMTVPAAYLYGKDTVRECMDDQLIKSYMNKGIFEEIIPTLDLPDSELQAFAAAVSERFANPFIKHYLLSISLNSTSKFKARVLPSITEYIKRKGRLPKVLTFSLAALIAFYKGTQIEGASMIGSRPGNTYNITDDMPVLEFFKGLWTEFDGSKDGTEKLVKAVLGNTGMWCQDLNNLPGFAAAVTDYLDGILTNGIGETIKEVMA